MGAPSKRAKKIRTKAEFNSPALARAINFPYRSSGIFAWTLTEIFAARDAQMVGSFELAARLAESMRTDDALAVAYENRLAPQRCIKVELVPAKGARALSIANEAEALFGQDGIGIHPDTLGDVHGCLVNHGIAFGLNTVAGRDDGTRTDFELRSWPIEYVRWDPMDRQFKTRTEDSYGDEVITHGDGRWVIFQKHDIDPWKQGAAVLPAALVWARHAYAIRDWAKASLAHGNAKVIGEMPEGVALQDAEGALTQDATAFLSLLQAIANSDTPVGIRPAGSKTDFLSNSSSAWQVWAELVLNAEKAAARIYLGTDGTLGSQGGAPGVDIETLFGVASTRVEGDLKCIERGILTGVIEPWCAYNFGDSTLAPQRRYLLPDADADAARAAVADRRQKFFKDIAETRANGFVITQDYVDQVAKVYGIDAPQLPEPSPPGTTNGQTQPNHPRALNSRRVAASV